VDYEASESHNAYRSARRLLAILKSGDRARAASLAHEVVARAWQAGDSSVANAATELACALGNPSGPYLGDLLRLMQEVTHRSRVSD
jgi:predicted MFS family arabinose efflux permease